MQREAQDARRVLGDKVNDSGTTERALANFAGGGGLVGLLTGAVNLQLL